MSGDGSEARQLLTVVGGVVVALAGVVLYAQFVFFDLSVTGRAATFGIAFVLSLVLAAASPLDEEAGLLAALVLVAFVGYTAIAFELDGTVVSVLAVGCLALLIVLTVAIQNRRLVLEPRVGAVVIVVVMLALAGVVAADLQPNELEYGVSLDDSVGSAVNTDQRAVDATIGAVSARNTGESFRERVDYPDARACLYTGGGNVSEQAVNYVFGSPFDYDTVAPGSTTTAEMTVLLGPVELSAFTPDTPIERASACPESSAEPKIVVVVENGTA